MSSQHILSLLSAVAAAGVGMAALEAPARAVTLTQTVGPKSFSINAGSAVTSPLITIDPFTASTPDTLVNVRIATSTTGIFSGSGTIAIPPTGTAPTVFSANAAPSFTFSTIGAILTGAPSAVTLTPDTANATGTFIPTVYSGTYPGSSYSASNFTATTSVLQSYFSTAPSIAARVLQASSVSSTPSGGLADYSGLILTGQLYITYEYNSTPVPAPTAIAGAAAAFAYTRKLRSNARTLRAFRNPSNS